MVAAPCMGNVPVLLVRCSIVICYIKDLLAQVTCCVGLISCLWSWSPCPHACCCLSQTAGLALRLQKGQNITCMHDHVEVRALFRDRWKRSKDQWDKRTLADGPLDVAHNQAVLVVQELHADLGDLRPECICQASLARCKLQKWTNLATRAGAPNDLHDDGELSGLILRRSTERECWSFCSLCTKPPGRNSAYHDVVDNEEGGREGGACISPSCGCTAAWIFG